MDDRRAALLLALLALSGAGVRYALAPAPAAPPGDVRLVAVDTPPHGDAALRAAARAAARLARLGPAFAQRIVAWREQHGLFGSLARLDSVPGVGPGLLETLRPYVMFSGVISS